MSGRSRSPHPLAPQRRRQRRLAAEADYTGADAGRSADDQASDGRRQRRQSAPDLAGAIIARLSAAGALAPLLDEDRVPTDPVEIEALEREYEAWLGTQTESLGLTEAVLADRQ